MIRNTCESLSQAASLPLVSKPSRIRRALRATGIVVAMLVADLSGVGPFGALVGSAEARPGHPLTPFSAAGVARRVTRRTIRRSTLFYSTLPPACVRTSVDGVTVWRCGGLYLQPYRGRYVVIRIY